MRAPRAYTSWVSTARPDKPHPRARGWLIRASVSGPLVGRLRAAVAAREVVVAARRRRASASSTGTGLTPRRDWLGCAARGPAAVVVGRGEPGEGPPTAAGTAGACRRRGPRGPTLRAVKARRRRRPPAPWPRVAWVRVRRGAGPPLAPFPHPRTRHAMQPITFESGRRVARMARARMAFRRKPPTPFRERFSPPVPKHRTRGPRSCLGSLAPWWRPKASCPGPMPREPRPTGYETRPGRCPSSAGM